MIQSFQYNGDKGNYLLGISPSFFVSSLFALATTAGTTFTMRLGARL